MGAMAVLLEGGCRVSGLKEGTPRRLPEPDPAVRSWRHAGRELGAQAMSLRVLELAPGAAAELRGHPACDEVLFVVEGEAEAAFETRRGRVAPMTGLYLAPGARLTLRASGAGPLTLVSARCPDPGSEPSSAPPLAAAAAPEWPVVRLEDVAAEVTGDRWYRVLLDGRVGCAQVTQFVGAIPPGRAPDHFHEYEEVLCVLQGTGRMWAGPTSTPVGPGSCVFLPRRQVHCMENTGGGELRLLGIFYPSGSPAVSYEPESG
jgi:mannose-6-phosphate isomerase-like protein (cupin superfamily)